MASGVRRFILNCDPSTGVQQDWTFADAVEAGVVADAAARAEVDLRGGDWPVRDQGTTGACVGFAAADGVLHWHYRQAGLLAAGERPSPRFIWMASTLSSLSTEAFYARAARYRIASYHNLGRDLERWRAWISNQGPVLVRLVVDRTWDRATAADGELDRYREDTSRDGHAVCLVGYTRTHLIVRNSWGQRWGDGGFAYASDAYAASAFGEAYGAVL